MALATQCPHCHTTFRVANDQLKLRAGMVRCGQCRQVFNGIANLLPPAGEQITGPAETGTEASSVPILPAAIIQPSSTPSQLADDARTGWQSGAGTNPAPVVAAIPAAMPAAIMVTAVTAQPSDAAPVAPAKYDPEDDDLEELDYEALGRMTLLHFAQAEPPVEQYYPTSTVTPDTILPGQLAPEARPLTAANTDSAPTPPDPDRIAYPLPAQASPVAAPAAENTVQEEPSFVTATRRQQHRKHRMRMLFVVGSAILVLVFMVQASYAMRHQIAAHLPQAKPVLLTICQVLGCSISLPAQIDATTIESSELQAQTSPPGTLVLTLLLRNRSSTAQAWPNIELTLNDGNQSAILRRVFTPQEFPVSAAAIAEGIASNSEQSVRLTFTLSQLQAAGYRVVLFYP
ncbi:MAG: DUF3426 domain-containing protein [Burkholderiaceae bacterium]